MTQIELARFRDKRVVLESQDLRHVPFVAISHVWSETKWQIYPGLRNREIPVSQHKMKFLEEQLPGLVGDSWFWMDVICVDQRDEDAKIAVVDHIPEIYRRAERTIVIKDGDGLRRCCCDAIGRIRSDDETWDQRLVDHLRESHVAKLISESWLERLWPLQEAMLSNKIQFTTCEERGEPKFHWYGERLSWRRIRDDLWTVSHAWVAYGREDEDVSGKFEDDSFEFMNAFLNNETVTRPKLPDTAFRPRGFSWELRQHSNSRRTTAKARDFILAIMPQYGWYTKPGKVKELTFAELFIDCYQQALDAESGSAEGESRGIAFIPRLTQGMIKTALAVDASNAMATDLPTPHTLGDFVRLLGSAAPVELKNLGLDLGEAELVIVDESVEPEIALSLLKVSIEFSSQKWMLTYIGELSAYDSLPEQDGLSGPSAIHHLLRSERSKQNLEDERRQWPESEAATAQSEAVNRLKAQYIEHECCRILNAAWGAWAQQDRNSMADWSSYQEWLLREKPQGYAMTLVYLTACVNCGLGISASNWVRTKMVPVFVKLSDFILLGLVRRGTTNLGINGQLEVDSTGYHAVQRISDFQSRAFDVHGFTGRDCVLTRISMTEDDRKTHKIIGLIPDIVDADSKTDFKARFETLFPNDGTNVMLTFVRLSSKARVASVPGFEQ